MLGRYLTRCWCMMWFLGIPSFQDMSNVGEQRRHWNYFTKCNRKDWMQTGSPS
jgi:hypothetical protein